MLTTVPKALNIDKIFIWHKTTGVLFDSITLGFQGGKMHYQTSPKMATDSVTAKTQLLRLLNDEFRAGLGNSSLFCLNETTAYLREIEGTLEAAADAPGIVVLSAGVARQPLSVIWEITRMVREFDDFDGEDAEEDDSLMLHDFGIFVYAGTEINWKIDCYDKTLQWLSDDPTDPDQVCRVLTIMLASEY